MVVLAANPEKIFALESDERLCEFFNSAELLLPDGIGVVWALRRKGVVLERVAGADFFEVICEEVAARQGGVFLLGGSEEVNAATALLVQEKFPGISIAGRRNGYFSQEEERQIMETIVSAEPMAVFVALGSPRQELFVERNRETLSNNANVVQCVGGTFDVFSGRVRRAPIVWRRLNLEWLFRLLSQPARFFRQLNLLRFAVRVLCER